jgi:hypothetical protein
VKKVFKIGGKTKKEIEAMIAEQEEASKKVRDVDVGAGEETVEPIMDSYNGYCGETLALLYQPYIIFLYYWYREELTIPTEIYGIKQADMVYYIWFASVIIGFQFIADCFLFNVLELFYGWKIHEYLVYSNYRFVQREKRWKGLEDSLDECIEEGMRTLDQMCFSSQYYFMNTIHATGIVLFTLAIEILLQQNHNLFGDPAFPLLVCIVWSMCHFVKKLSIWVATKCSLWKLKHDETGWHSQVREGDGEEFAIPGWDELEKLQQESHEAYILNQKITSETFRHKFLDYNRPWLVAQLPQILTPRTLRRSRPYLVSQFSKILGSVNPDISSDSEDDADMPKFGPVMLSSTSATIAKLWLAQARRRRRLREVVEPLIERARRSECEQCLSRRSLHVELVIPIELLGDRFEQQQKERGVDTSTFDQLAWKEFFQRYEQFRTLCLQCIAKSKDAEEKRKIHASRGDITSSDEDDEEVGGKMFSSKFKSKLYLSAASKAIMQKWLKTARRSVVKRHPLMAIKRKVKLEISSDSESDDNIKGFEWAKKEIQINAASAAIAKHWLGKARKRLNAGVKKTGIKLGVLFKNQHPDRNIKRGRRR